MNNVKSTTGKCELCGSAEGELLLGGVFNYLCKPCQDKANKVIKRWNRYLLTIELGDLPEIIGKKEN